jgi:hypothetical protein
MVINCRGKLKNLQIKCIISFVLVVVSRRF